MSKPRPKRPKLLMTKSQAESFTQRELEIMQRRIDGELPERIQALMGLSPEEYVAITQNPRWNDEYEFQTRDVDRRIKPRLDRLASEALDVVTNVMRSATNPAYQLRAALEILDRAGHVKIEKSVHVHANAESVIRHLNQLGIEPAQLNAPQPDAMEASIVETPERVDATQSIENAAREVREAMKNA